MSKICTKCILPSTFPKISFNSEGVCNFCVSGPSPEAIRQERELLSKRMDETILKLKGKGDFDCIVAFSGGKDSSFTLVKLVQDYGLRCLAVTIDNGFIPAQAIENCQSVTSALNVDFMLFRPSGRFMNNMYKKSATEQGVHAPAAIKRASNICSSCINLINNHMVKSALQMNVPMIAGGYIGGQVPKETAILSLDPKIQIHTRRMDADRYTKSFGAEAGKYFGLDQNVTQNFQFEKLTILNPMLTVYLTEEKIREQIRKFGWQDVQNTGKHSTNCQLNDLGIAVHFKQYGFHPYVLELAEQVRAGLLDREETLAKVQSIPSDAEVSVQAKKIGITL